MVSLRQPGAVQIIESHRKSDHSRGGRYALVNSLRIAAIAYDSGTEANSEAAGTIPGPVDGGQGFAPVRDDPVDRVLMHSGVLTAAGGTHKQAGSRIGNAGR